MPFAAAWLLNLGSPPRASSAKASPTRSIIASPRSITRCSSRATWIRTLADKFIGMYVNKWTLDYGEAGRKAVREFLGRGAAAGLVPSSFKMEFVSDAA